MSLKFEPSPYSNPERRAGRRDRYFIRNFSEQSNPELAEQAKRVHAEGYVNEGFVKPEALNADRTLPSDIDKARGPNVDFLLSVGWDVNVRNTLSQEQATMRKVNIPKGQKAEYLPAYQLCVDNLEPQYKEFLDSIEDPSKTLKEIAALARTKDASPMAVFELLRDALQEARTSEETWFFSIVSTTYDSLVENFGSNAIKQIGKPVAFDDERIGEGIRLVPALVQTDLFIDEIRRSAIETEDKDKQSRLVRSFMFFTEGLSDDTLSADSAEYRQFIKDLITKKSVGGAA